VNGLIQGHLVMLISWKWKVESGKCDVSRRDKIWV